MVLDLFYSSCNGPVSGTAGREMSNTAIKTRCVFF